MAINPRGILGDMKKYGNCGKGGNGNDMSTV